MAAGAGSVPQEIQCDDEYTIVWYSIDGGGGISRFATGECRDSDDDWFLQGTVGQSMAGVWDDGCGESWIAGFWTLDDGIEYNEDDWDGRIALLPLENSGVAARLSPVVESPILEFSLSPVAPNPTPGAAQVAWAMPRTAQVRLTVHDVQGRQLAVLADGSFPAGRHHVTWNDSRQGRAAPGMYFVRLQSPERAFVRRVVVTP
jgi:hypothetical protein